MKNRNKKKKITAKYNKKKKIKYKHKKTTRSKRNHRIMMIITIKMSNISSISIINCSFFSLFLFLSSFAIVYLQQMPLPLLWLFSCYSAIFYSILRTFLDTFACYQCYLLDFLSSDSSLSLRTITT